ncbi:hypothetical protein ABID26_002269 [Mesorhizobium shonense]|uniref:Serine protease n=1 Tax=Mesorhizobium shonense TaxID=1209948 RepID=A0ABV2HQM2_9HYPH
MPIMQQSVQSLLIEMTFQGIMLSTGTAFLMNYKDGTALITNRHNLTGRHQQTDQPLSAHGGVPDSISIWQNSQNGLGHWHRETYPIYRPNGDPAWQEHPQLGAQADIVALPLTVNPLARVYPYSSGTPDVDILVTPGDTVSVIGFPFGLTGGGRFAIWATGFLATELDIDYDNRPVFLIDCRSRPGQSGSPVVASRSGGMVPLTNGNKAVFGGPVSAFLGIYSGRINDQSDLGIVWKRTAIAELVASL